MSFQSKSRFVYVMAGLIFLGIGWSCAKLTNPSGISDKEVVAVVGTHNITFGDWMKEMDMGSVFMQNLDPNNKEEAQNVLTTLIDREIICVAAQQAHYSDPTLDESLKTDLSKVDTQLKAMKDEYLKKLEAIKRVQKNYQNIYKKEMLARKYSSNQAEKMVVTDQEMKDWFKRFSEQAKKRGQKIPPFEQVKARVKERVQMEKFTKQIHDQFNVKPNTDVINKYLSSLSMSGMNYEGSGNSSPVAVPPGAKRK